MPSAAARCSGPVSFAIIERTLAQQRGQLVEIGGRSQDGLHASNPSRICRAMWISSGPPEQEQADARLGAEPLGQRAQVRDRPALVLAAGAGVERDQRRPAA